jgi:Tol biopolymer transport system component
MRIRVLSLAAIVGMVVVNAGLASRAQSAATRPAAASTAATVDVTVSEGTSMAVAVSPDGRTLAVDLQGSIWTLPAAGGQATRITDVFNDARQPAWSPDGRTIAFFAYRDGGYDLWAINPDGTHQRKLTDGAFDDREPVWSHDGSRIAFSSDRGNPLGSDYNIWVLEVASGALRQLTTNPAEDSMPSWSPDDADVSFVSTRDGERHVWAVPARGGAERQLATSSGRVDAASWGPGGQIVLHALEGRSSRLEIAGAPITGAENAFPFRPSWVSATEFFYTADGKIRRRTVGGASFTDVPFTATLQATPARYTRVARNFDSRTPRKVLGLVRPMLSPDASKVAFAAVGDIWVMPIGGAAENLTKDRFLDTDPAWSPDGTKLVYSSDKGGSLLQLWVRDLATGQDRQLTRLTTQPQGATWSPDGSRIAFFNVDGMWRRAEVSVVDVASGAVTRIHESLFSPGNPTWSADGARVAVGMVASYSTRFREGTNQVLTMSSKGGDDKWFAAEPNKSIDSRGGGGPVWSPDGTKMAAIYEGLLAVWPVAGNGEPTGPVRRVTSEMAHAPSWAGDSKRLLYQSMDKLRMVDIETGQVTDVPLNLTYTPAVPTGRTTVHVSRLVDGVTETARGEMDIVVEGNRIRSVVAHSAANHRGTVVDGTGLTAMPGLIEFHSHLQKDFGEAQGRAWLAFGVTTVRSPGNTPYEAVEDREANEAAGGPGRASTAPAT